jgi:hypothetical protein
MQQLSKQVPVHKYSCNNGEMVGKSVFYTAHAEVMVMGLMGSETNDCWLGPAAIYHTDISQAS